MSKWATYKMLGVIGESRIQINAAHVISITSVNVDGTEIRLSTGEVVSVEGDFDVIVKEISGEYPTIR